MLPRIFTKVNLFKYKRKTVNYVNAVRHSTEITKIKILFFGTDKFSLPSLKELHNASLDNTKVSTVSVVTSFKAPFNCIKRYAEEHSLSTFEWPVSKQICQEYDLGVVVSFGHLIPNTIIKSFSLGMINVHASMLPRWRGAAPIIYSIMKGDTKTGVSIMRIEPDKFDIGDVYAQKEVPIRKNVLMPELHDVLAKEGACLLKSTIEGYPETLRNFYPQDEKKATYAPKIKNSTLEVRWESMTASETHNLYRALFGYKYLFTKFRGLTIKLVDIQLGPQLETKNVCPGSVEYVPSMKGLRVKCCDNTSIDVFKLRVGGKRTMSGLEFANGFLKKVDKSKWIFN